ncbi:MAG TPA: NAD-dependent epimerase/dehydratase family protein [Candidatus Acidoferrales bacterium]|nr:NAD-dependent epimerase/dehydratase family protein [Candidatus Acidoferrales bacterium]
MRVLIIGGDGYCGWASALRLSERGHDVTILDNLVRRRWDRELGVSTLTPIRSMAERLRAWERVTGRSIRFIRADATDYGALCDAIEESSPEAIVNFGQQRSAPYSMIDRDHAARTMINNTLCNLNVLWAMREFAPEAHLVKLGTMGEYGTPNIEIEEGFITIEHKGRRDTLPFPKQPGSFYHLTKVADSDQIYFACRVWGLRATDLNQGVVYGLETAETSLAPELINRFDYDGVFGTALNRFCVQAALGHPLTVYGRGGQTRAFLNITDTARCVELAVESPAPAGTFRVFNQFTQTFSVLALAHHVERVGKTLGLNVRIDHVENPRVEREAHFYSSLNTNLLALGLDPVLLDDETVASMIESACLYRERVDRKQIMPKVRWKSDRAVEVPAQETAV